MIFALYLTLWVDQSHTITNDAGFCNEYSYYTYCYINNNNNTDAIKELLFNSTQGTQYRLYVYKYYAEDKGFLTLDIKIGENIRYMYLYNSYSSFHDQVILTTSSINNNLQYMYCNYRVTVESQDFFNQFVALTYIYFSDIASQSVPSFSRLVNLRYLRATITTGGNQVLDSSFVGGLRYLSRLTLSQSSLTSIAENAFDNMDSLTYLSLYRNKISSIEDNAFRGITNLRYLNLEDNGLKDVAYGAFRDLDKLSNLDLDENPDFPLSVLIPLRNLEYLYLSYNNLQTIDPFIFQQMNSLRYLYMDNPFTCDCNLEWASVVKQYGITIRNSYCLNPPSAFGRSIANEDSYINCTQNMSYHCFDSSNTCEIGEVCHNTDTSYTCGCPIGYEFNNIGHCGDINECDETNMCRQICVNTDGTFHCACNEGYTLLDNGYDCEDINECQEWNGGCEQGCMNTLGSYQCYCVVGYQLNNKTSCNPDFQCELVGNSYDPLNCSDGSETILNCNSKLNFSVTNLPCVNVVVPTVTCATTESAQQTTTATTTTTPPTTPTTTPTPTTATTATTTTTTATAATSTSTQQATLSSFLDASQWNNPTLILLIIPFIIVAIQTIVILILIACILKRSKGSKNNNDTPSIGMRNLRDNLPINSIYETTREPHEIEIPEKLFPNPPSMGNQTEMHINKGYSDPDPGNGTT